MVNNNLQLVVVVRIYFFWSRIWSPPILCNQLTLITFSRLFKIRFQRLGV